MLVQRSHMRPVRYITAFLIVVASPLAAQIDFTIPSTNSHATLTQTIAATTIEISYNRPNTRGRDVFGSVVPYGKVWRTGSDATTKIHFDTPVLLEGNHVDSGRYELFTVPGRNQWEIRLQKASNQWGSYKYDPGKDLLMFSVTAQSSKTVTETFTISIDNVASSSALLQIAWDDVVVPIRIDVDLMATVVPGLERALQQEGRRPYFHAAMFYYENDIDIDRAAELMELALEQNPGHIGMLYRQALILEKKGDMAGAKKAAEASLAGARMVDGELKEEYTRLNTAFLKQLGK